MKACLQHHCSVPENLPTTELIQQNEKSTQHEFLSRVVCLSACFLVQILELVFDLWCLTWELPTYVLLLHLDNGGYYYTAIYVRSASVVTDIWRPRVTNTSLDTAYIKLVCCEVYLYLGNTTKSFPEVYSFLLCNRNNVCSLYKEHCRIRCQVHLKLF